jgi:hypothetical protein
VGLQETFQVEVRSNGNVNDLPWNTAAWPVPPPMALVPTTPKITMIPLQAANLEASWDDK